MPEKSSDFSTFYEVLKHLVNTRLEFVYLNHKGEVEIRKVIIQSIFFGVKEPYYKEAQWLFDAFDFDKQDVRTFSFTRICSDEVNVNASQDSQNLSF